MNIILSRKQGEIFIFTKLINQYPPHPQRNKNAEIQLLNEYENSTVVFDDMLLSKLEKKLICFSQQADAIILIFTIVLKAIFISQKILFVIILR